MEQGRQHVCRPFCLSVIKWLISLLAVACCFRVHAAGKEVYVRADGFAHSESKAVKSITGNWGGDLHPGDVAFSVDRMEVGIVIDSWRIGYISRYDYYFEYSPDTAELINASKNKLPLTPGAHYDLYLYANTLVSKGLRIEYRQRYKDLSYGFAVSYLKGSRFSNGTIRGDAVSLSDKDYDFNFDVDYYYSQDKLFDRQVEQPQGRGYALDLDLSWQVGDRLRLGLRADDILARMFWRDAPRTIATATSDTKEFDSSGYVRYKPVISGLETSQNYVQNIPRKLFLSADYTIRQYDVTVEYRDYDLKGFLTIGVSKPSSEQTNLGFLCNLTAKSCGIDISGKWYTFRFMTDKLDLQDARTLELLFSVSYVF
jgi:hypothetical protein